MKLNVDSLSKKFNNEYALKDINFEIKKETLAVIGPSGSGKSTLLRVICGLENPSSGHIKIDDVVVSAKNRKKLSRKIGMVFQHCHLFPHMNILENLTYAPINVLGISNEEAENAANSLLKQFSVAGKINAMPNDLSGGQKQRIAIARAMMMKPEMVLFDEPISALDPEVTKDVYTAIQDLKKDVTIIVVTHDIKFGTAISDRVIFMDKGMVLCDQPVAEFIKKPKSQRARLFIQNVDNY